MFRLRATYFARVGKVGKAPPGAAHGHFQCPIPPRPGPPLFLRESYQRAKLYPSGAGKRQDIAPRAARYRSVFLEQVLAPTRAVAPGFHPSRGGLVVAPPPWLVPDAQRLPQKRTCSRSALASVFVAFHTHYGAGTSRLPSPWGVHPIGGPRPPCVGRFKGMGYLGEGGNRNPPSPRQFFGDFLSAQKVTRPEAKHPHPPPCPQAKSPVLPSCFPWGRAAARTAPTEDPLRAIAHGVPPGKAADGACRRRRGCIFT